MSKYKPTREELVLKLSKLQKKADRRMRELEKLAETEEFKSATRFAYRRAAKDAMIWGGNPDKPRFDIKIPDTMRKDQIQAKIHDIESFLEKPSSSKSGIINIYKKTAETLNTSEEFKKYDLNLSWDQLKTFFESDLYKKLRPLGSDVAVRAIGRIKRNRMQVYKAIKNSTEANINTSGDALMVKDAINKAVKDYGDDIKDLLGKL